MTQEPCFRNEHASAMPRQTLGEGNVALASPVTRMTDHFLTAYHQFRGSVDLTQGGVLPELDSLVWCLLMGIPEVPADDSEAPEASLEAVEQRVLILKAVFVEVNSDQPETFLDLGLARYDQAGRKAKRMLAEEDASALSGHES